MKNNHRLSETDVNDQKNSVDWKLERGLEAAILHQNHVNLLRFYPIADQQHYLQHKHIVMTSPEGIVGGM